MSSYLNTTSNHFSLIIPVYNNEGSIHDLLKQLEAVSFQMVLPLEVVFVVDGSPDQSYSLLESNLPKMAFDSQLISLSRNFGSFQAIIAGISQARGNYIGVISADLQEPPELILDFNHLLLSGNYDVVVGTRSGKREDPLLNRLFASLFWTAYRLIVQKEMPRGGIDLFACTREFADQLLQLKERNTTLVGLIFWLGFRRGEISYTRRARQHGKSAWSYRRRFKYLLDSAFAFSSLPVKLMSLIGITGVVVSTVLGLIILIAKQAGLISVPGYTPITLLIMFFGGLNSLGIGLIGEYIWRTFENTKGRPNFIITQHRKYNSVSDK